MKNLFAFLFLLCSFSCNAEDYRGSSFQKLDNGVSVVFVDTTKSDSLLVMLCVSAGSTDELDKEGVANLLNYMFAKKLRENANIDSLQYGSESNSYTGYDRSVYYFYGKLENLEGFVRNLGEVFSSVSFSADDLSNGKRVVEQNFISERQTDKAIIRSESRKSVYWHSKYGADVSGNPDKLKKISEQDISDFKDRHYTNNRATVIIAGNVKKDSALSMVSKYFGNGTEQSNINRLQEPPHHDSTTKITKHSAQINVPVMEMYWRIPNYRNEKDKALAAEIFINHLDETLQKSLIDDQKIASSISFSYSFWNYDYGDFCMTITLKNSDKLDELEAAILSEIKNIASDGISKVQADKASKKMLSASNLLNGDVIDAVDWISKKIGSCYEFDFIKGYPDFVKKYNLDEINAQAKAIFKNDPCVISIIKPLERKNAI